jgi:hypothetical protein
MSAMWVAIGEPAEVALVCTEIPLLVTPEASPVPTLDSTRLLARAALGVSLGEQAMPAWRGGPVRELPDLSAVRCRCPGEEHARPA